MSHFLHRVILVFRWVLLSRQSQHSWWWLCLCSRNFGCISVLRVCCTKMGWTRVSPKKRAQIQAFQKKRIFQQLQMILKVIAHSIDWALQWRVSLHREKAKMYEKNQQPVLHIWSMKIAVWDCPEWATSEFLEWSVHMFWYTRLLQETELISEHVVRQSQHHESTCRVQCKTGLAEKKR